MNEFNCNRLKEARILRGFSQTDMADKIGVTKQCISQYENGIITPRGDALFEIAQILDMPIQYFGMASMDNANTPIFFRSGKTAKKKMRDVFKVYINWTGELYLYISQYINLPELNMPKKTQEAYAFEEINNIAQELRSYWKIGNGPISNLTLLLENNGFIISKTPLSGELVEACSQFYTNTNTELNRPMLFLTSSKSAVRSRRDLAHELGHQILHSWRGIEGFEQYNDSLEKEAEIFASCFLMPSSAMEREVFSVTSLESLLQLKKRWGTSAQSILYHLHNLGLVSDIKFEKLKRSIYVHRWKKCEPFDEKIPHEEPSVFREAITMLVEAGVKTTHEIQNDMPFPVEDLSRLCGVSPMFFSKPEETRAKLRLVGK